MNELVNFSLRAYTMDDLDMLVKHANNPRIASNLTDMFPHPYKKEDGEKFINMTMQQDPKQIFAIDIGAGTEDVLLYDDTKKEIENCVKMVLPSPSQVLAAKVREATRLYKDVFVEGDIIGGGAFAFALRNHVEKGLRVVMTENAAYTVRNDLDQVRKLADHLGQRVQSVFDALIRREQAEREHHVFACDPELVLAGVRVDEGHVGDPVGDDVNLLLGHAVDIHQEGPAAFRGSSSAPRAGWTASTPPPHMARPV